jgi:hypothetical protein
MITTDSSFMVLLGLTILVRRLEREDGFTSPIGRFQQEKISTTPSGSGSTNAVAGKATNGVAACTPNNRNVN